MRQLLLFVHRHSSRSVAGHRGLRRTVGWMFSPCGCTLMPCGWMKMPARMQKQGHADGPDKTPKCVTLQARGLGAGLL